MISDLTEIKKVRKMLGLSQQDLAIQSGVSQSLIAKIEAGRVDPTYTHAKKIFDVLTTLKEQGSLKAQDVMNSSVTSVPSSERIKKAIMLMKEKGISQLPIVHNDRVLGLITEKSIVNHLSTPHLEDLSVQEVMEDCPPIISPQTTHTVVVNLLKEYPFLIVSQKGALAGIISRADVLERLP